MPSRPSATPAIALVLGVLSVAIASTLCGSAQAATASSRGDARWVVVSAPGLKVPPAATGTPWVGSAFSGLVGRSAVGLMPAHSAQVLVSQLTAPGAGVTVLPADDATGLARVAGAMATATAGGRVALLQTAPLTGPAGARGAAQLEQAVGVLDLSPGVSVLIVAPPAPGARAELTPVVVSEPRTRLAGLLASATTRRGEVVSETDLLSMLTASRLARDALGLAPGVPAGADSLARVLVTHRAVAVVDSVSWTILGGYIVVFLLLLGTGAIVAWRTGAAHRARRVSAAALTAPLVVPLAAYLVVLTVPRPSATAWVLVPFLVWAAILVAIVVACAWRWGSRWAASGALLVTSLVLIADQLLGAPLLFANVFGYSLADGARFYGIGNEGAALLLGTIATAIALVAPPPKEQESATWRVSAGAALGLALLVCVAPWWGANLLVAVWGAVLAIGVWAGVAFDRPRPGDVAWIAALVALAAVALAAVDYVVGVSHVGLALRAIVARPATIRAIVSSRVATDVRTLTGNGWTIVLLAMLIVLIWVRIRPSIGVWRAFADRPAVRSLATSAITATIVALIVEDTGGSIGAFLVPLALTAILLGVLEPDQRGRRLVRARVPR